MANAKIEAAKAVRNIVVGAVAKAADNPSVALNRADVREVSETVAADVVPAVLHATNNESWFQSRVTLGSVATILSSGFALYALLAAGITDGELLAPPIGAIAGAAFALYGRWKARKPIAA